MSRISPQKIEIGLDPGQIDLYKSRWQTVLPMLFLGVFSLTALLFAFQGKFGRIGIAVVIVTALLGGFLRIRRLISDGTFRFSIKSDGLFLPDIGLLEWKTIKTIFVEKKLEGLGGPGKVRLTHRFYLTYEMVYSGQFSTRPTANSLDISNLNLKPQEIANLIEAYRNAALNIHLQ